MNKTSIYKPYFCTDKMCGSVDCKTCYPGSWRHAMNEEYQEEIIEKAVDLLDKKDNAYQMEFLEQFWELPAEEWGLGGEKTNGYPRTVAEAWVIPEHIYGTYIPGEDITLYQYSKELWIENARDEAKGISFDELEGFEEWSMYQDYMKLNE